MTIRRFAPLALAVLAVSLAPRAASALVSLDAFYGIARPPSSSFSTATAGVHSSDLFSSSLNIAGGDLILHLGTLEVGAIADHSWKSGSASQTSLGGLVGLGADLGGTLRVEGLAEVGGHRYGSLTSSNIASSSGEQWLAYIGLRPGVALKLPGTGFMVGVWAFARWDLTTKNYAVTVGNAGNTAPGSYKLGGAQIGATLRVGLDF